MMRLISVIIGLIVTFFTVVLCCGAPANETQVGSLNLTPPLMTEPEIVSRFGQGCVEVIKFGNKVFGKKHIYYVSDEDIWVEIRLSHVLNNKLERVVEGVLVTKQRLCNKKVQPKKSFGILATSRGIRIGDSVDKVIQTYGAPSISIEVGKDKSFSVLAEDLKLTKGRVLRYLTDQPDELIFSEFYFDRKGLHSLLISASE